MLGGKRHLYMAKIEPRYVHVAITLNAAIEREREALTHSLTIKDQLQLRVSRARSIHTQATGLPPPWLATD